jgi:hypothetical protein
MRAALAVVCIAVCGGWPRAAAAQSPAASPAAQVAASYPALFPPGSLEDAAASGERGARLIAAGAAAAALGLRTGDVVLAAGGKRLGGGAGAFADTTFVVWRSVPGERPVLESSVLGRQTLDEFAALPPAEHIATRLAIMLANRATLVREGAGLVFVPPVPPTDVAAWERAGALLPSGSEAALQEVTRAVNERVLLPPAPHGELQEARAKLASHDYLEAAERAQRAVLEVVADPARRTARADFDAAVATFLTARQAERQYQAQLLAPEPRLGILLEGRVGRIQAFLPQHTLLEVENATSLGFAAGLRLGWPFGPIKVLDDFSLVVEYGFTSADFDDERGVTILSTILHEANFELLYRPRVAARLKPYLRAGGGAHYIDANIHDDGVAYPAFDRVAPAWLFGGGIDVFRWTAARMRVSIGGSYRLLTYTFPVEAAPNIELHRNTLPILQLDVDGHDDRYRFDMSGWQAGIMLSFEL